MIKKPKKEQLLIGVLAGILLLVIAIPVPDKKDDYEEKESKVEVEEKAIGTTEAQLKEILQKISGVGRAEVFITYEDQGKVVVEKDESVSEELIQEADSSGGTRTTTTTRNDRETVYDGSESPYVIQELSPTVKGILVVAEGGGNETVKKQIQETIEALFGLDAHKISIMKMEVSK
ncbi:MAG: stage III sporulation protein AG [Lachnospiraceae bacterium]|nr:stage III sporulation protein AG [Lachnospiraceae bacterium]MEE1015802.1 stage III sporulation protein AG [Lachnospiraceae bacterium]